MTAETTVAGASAAAAALSSTSSLSSRAVDAAFLAQDSGGKLTGISIAFIVLTTVFIGLRYYSRRFVAVNFGLDDAFLLAAYAVDLGMCAICIVSVKVGGVGRHIQFIEELNPIAEAGWAQSILAFEIVYFTSMGLPKMAIMFMYLRIFNWEGKMRGIAYTLIGLLAATSLSLILAACFQCQPLAFWWDRTIPGGTCFDVQLFFHAQAIPGAILDVMVMVLPLNTIWHLKLPLHKRIALLFIFAVGSFGIVASIIRATVFFSTSAFSDRTFASVDLLGWSVVETGSYIIAGCLPATRPLFSHYTPSWIKDMFHKSISYIGSSVASAAMRSRSRSRSHSRSHNTKNAKSQHTTDGGVSLASGKWMAQKGFSSGKQTMGAAATTTSSHSGTLEADPGFHDRDDDGDFGATDDDDRVALRPYPQARDPSHKHGNNQSSVGSIVVTREVMLYTEEREYLEEQCVQREDWARHGN